MEFVHGLDVNFVLKKSQYISLLEGLDILIPVCDGFAHAHREKILHRDIKPANIMLKLNGGESPTPKILDFGIAKLKDPAAHTDVRLTQPGKTISSPHYMSPEQIRGYELDE